MARPWLAWCSNSARTASWMMISLTASCFFLSCSEMSPSMMTEGSGTSFSILLGISGLEEKCYLKVWKRLCDPEHFAELLAGLPGRREGDVHVHGRDSIHGAQFLLDILHDGRAVGAHRGSERHRDLDLRPVEAHAIDELQGPDVDVQLRVVDPLQGLHNLLLLNHRERDFGVFISIL